MISYYRPINTIAFELVLVQIFRNSFRLIQPTDSWFIFCFRFDLFCVGTLFFPLFIGLASRQRDCLYGVDINGTHYGSLALSRTLYSDLKRIIIITRTKKSCLLLWFMFFVFFFSITFLFLHIAVVLLCGCVCGYGCCGCCSFCSFFFHKCKPQWVPPDKPTEPNSSTQYKNKLHRTFSSMKFWNEKSKQKIMRCTWFKWSGAAPNPWGLFACNSMANARIKTLNFLFVCANIHWDMKPSFV